MLKNNLWFYGILVYCKNNMLEIIACLFNQTRFLYYKHWYLLDHQVISFLLYADKLEITLRVKLFWQIILNNFFLHFFFFFSSLFLVLQIWKLQELNLKIYFNSPFKIFCFQSRLYLLSNHYDLFVILASFLLHYIYSFFR